MRINQTPKHAPASFVREYWQFAFAATSLAVALALQLSPFARVALQGIGVVSLALSLPILYRMYQDIRSGHYGIDILAATAIISAVLLGEQWAAIIVVIMLTGGEALEDYAGRRAQSELRALLAKAPTYARLVKDKEVIEVKIELVKIDHILEIRSGDIIPVDAIIIEGTTSVDESSLTGESLPQLKSIGDAVLSGSIVIDSLIRVKVTHSAADSQYQRIIELVRKASETQSPFVRLADKYSIPFTIVAYVIAISVWLISGDPVRFLEVIVVATPCPLLLAAPIALISGMSHASRYGIIVKTGTALEKLASVQTIAFDKTGTLTQGTPVVDKIITYGAFSDTDILGFAAGLEQGSNHILAEAIVNEAKHRSIAPAKAQDIKEVTGNGMAAVVGTSSINLGHYNFMIASNVKLPTDFNQEDIQQTATYISVNGELAGIISFTDKPRPESKSTLASLRKLGINHIWMLSGDNKSAAKLVADHLGITEYRAHLLPEDKLQLVKNMPDQPVAFVGDGVNDAPVLTAATVGIALGAKGSTAASESADLVIMTDNLSSVVKAITIARQTFQIARQSILIGIGLSVGLMLIFATGKFSPIAGALIQEVVDVIVIFNALRAHANGRA
jgi:heavy metal translocating P-type ATPase